MSAILASLNFQFVSCNMILASLSSSVCVSHCDRFHTHLPDLLSRTCVHGKSIINQIAILNVMLISVPQIGRLVFLLTLVPVLHFRYKCQMDPVHSTDVLMDITEMPHLVHVTSVMIHVPHAWALRLTNAMNVLLVRFLPSLRCLLGLARVTSKVPVILNSRLWCQTYFQ